MATSLRAAPAFLLCTLLLAGCDRPEEVVTIRPVVGVVNLKTEPATLSSDLPGRIVAAETAEVRPQVGASSVGGCSPKGLSSVRGRCFTRSRTHRTAPLLQARRVRLQEPKP